MAMLVDSSVGGDWGLFGCVNLGFELESERPFREWGGLVLSMSLSQIGV